MFSMESRHTRIFGLFITLGLFLFAFIFKDNRYANSLLGAAIGSAITLSTDIGGWILCFRHNLRTILRAIFISKLRISCSYLYRIKVEDQYLLIKSRKHGKFQPVGGNFKRNKLSHDSLHKLEITEDDKFTNGGRSAADLRLYIRGYRLSQFLSWYNSPDKKREVSYDREFYEELVEPGFLPSSIFKYPIIDFVKQVITPVRYSSYLKCQEVHIYDIIELNPNIEQLQALKELKIKGNTSDLKWCTASSIRSQGYNPENMNSPFEITDHSIEILN